MPFKIQRVPRGLSNLLNLSGGQTPIELEDRVRPVLEQLQLYGLTQLQTAFANAPALVESAAVTVTLSPVDGPWTVLFAAHCAIVKTATMTALRGRTAINRRTQFSTLLAVAELGPFGATETGTVNVGGFLPYPLLCPPGTFVVGVPEIIGTDANANVSVFAEFGTLG